MVDFKKEIKLSDLLPKRKQKPGVDEQVAGEAEVAKPKKERRSLSFSRKPKEPKQPKAPKQKKQKKQKEPKGPKAASSKRIGRPARHKKLVGLKIGASQIAAARIENNGAAQLLQVARQPLEQGVVVGGELRDHEALAEQLRAAVDRGAWVMSLCSGAFTLGKAGVLDGRRATTHWMHTRELADALQEVDVVLDEAVVEDGNVITSRTPVDLPQFVEAIVAHLSRADDAPAAG